MMLGGLARGSVETAFAATYSAYEAMLASADAHDGMQASMPPLRSHTAEVERWTGALLAAAPLAVRATKQDDARGARPRLRRDRLRRHLLRLRGDAGQRRCPRRHAGIHRETLPRLARPLTGARRQGLTAGYPQRRLEQLQAARWGGRRARESGGAAHPRASAKFLGSARSA